MDKGKIFESVIEGVKSLLQLTQRDEQNFEQLNGGTDIFDDLGIDSVEVMDLLGLLEKKFSTTFEIDEFGNRKTIQDIADFINEQMAKKSG